ncbi:MAG: hypothetical protein RIK87_15720 [Fuerstiella sp.]
MLKNVSFQLAMLKNASWKRAPRFDTTKIFRLILTVAGHCPDRHSMSGG